MASSNAPTTADAVAPAQNVTTPAASKPKLHGRAFYESLGSPKFVVAPMVDQSEFVSFQPIACIIFHQGNKEGIDINSLFNTRHGACLHDLS